MDFIINTFILLSSGIILLRLFGRRSIGQMTIGEGIIMISIGSLLVSPIGNESVLNTVIIAVIYIVVIMVLQRLQVKSISFTKLLTGTSVVIVDEGKIVKNNLKKLRLTETLLEMLLRQQGVTKLSDVKTATLEPNGRVGYELYDDAKPVTFRDIKPILQALNLNTTKTPNENENIFTEIKRNK
ncbi:DUF421 domain-containing protein [Haloplasma contractile]|uniref:Transmembrane protein YdfR n=1 Tax=Haloplasma contractile SSD-17B TaxID=1033810 RepID=U2EAK0_9MOLU|nr:YetF domain-containing protein [Haloplasma contractile]ERJ12128.1 transmembrane protein YdfR [Haloplasma contractile SSD-17B]